MSSSSNERDRKGGLSCAECRRSKLKCDRVFPCQSCIRRGCGHLCPDGTLAATKGNKVLMAHAQRLTEQVKAKNTRIQELEKALSEAQGRSGGESSHPLLQSGAGKNPTDFEFPQLETIYDDDEGLRTVSDAIGSLAIGLHGKAKYYGETAGSEYFQELVDYPPGEDANPTHPQPRYLGLPFEILDLVNAFPLGLKDSQYTKTQFLSFLPSKERAMEIADLYYSHYTWMYDPVVRHNFLEYIFNPIYGSTGLTSLDTIHAHRLSVFFMTMATGVWFDNHPSATILAHQYHALARAALSVVSIIQETTCATVQTLFMMIRFIYLSERSNNEERWILLGLCARIAQTIGLQRDSAGWNLSPDEVQRRRVIFWELFVHDAWSSVVNGRPPSLNIQQTDCRFPDDLDPYINSSGETEPGWHAWMFRYSASCLSISVQHVFSTKVPSYTALLELDRKIREFPVPPHLQSPMPGSEVGRSWSHDELRANQQFCAVCMRHSNLLYIHRTSFAQAIRAEPADPLNHKFGPSVLATYRSATTLISTLRSLYAVHQNMASEQWFFWSGVFSSCIVLGSLVVESPGCSLARYAFKELEQALPFYEQGSRACRTAITLDMVQKLLIRARSAFTTYHMGSLHNDPSRNHNPDELDILELLGGRKKVITTNRSSSSPVSNPSTSSNASTSSPHPFSLNEAPEDPPMQSQQDSLQMGVIPPALFDYYNTLNTPVPETVNLDVAIATTYPSSSLGREEPRKQAGLMAQPPQVVHQTYNPNYFAPQQAPFMQSSTIQQPGPMDITMANELNQDEIWRDFIRDLGIKP